MDQGNEKDIYQHNTLFLVQFKSMSQLSISQGKSKKMKNSTQETKSLNDNNSNQSEQVNCVVYKPSKYLRIPRKLLLQALRLQLNSPLKKKKE